MADQEFDPWETSIHGIKRMEPWEDELWRAFEKRVGFGWSETITPTLSKRFQQIASLMDRLHQHMDEDRTRLAIDILTGKETSS